MGLVACASPAPEDSGPQTIVIGTGPGAFTFSPLDNGTLNWGSQPVYDGLLLKDQNEAAYLPWLAEEWELSDRNHRMTIKLREDVDFIDGEHLDAQAVADFFVLLDASDAWLTREQVGLEIAVTDEYTLEFTSVEPMGEKFMDDVMAGTPIASPVAAQDRDGLLEKPVGSGPYLIDESVPEVSITFVRNPDYWNPEAYPFDEIEFVAFPDPVAAANALQSGQIDATVVDKSQAASLEAAGFDVTSGPELYNTLIVLDYEGRTIPALGDLRVRQAIAMALDQESILENLEQGYGTVDDRAFAPWQSTYVEGPADVYPYDVDAAKELMAEAGYADGFDVVIPGASVSFYPTSYEPIIQQSLAEIGIRVTFEPFADVFAYIEALQSGEYQLLLIQPNYANTIGVIIGAAPLYGYFGQDPTFSRLVVELNEGVEGAGQELGQYMLDQAWHAPIDHVDTIWATDSDVEITEVPFFNLSAFRPAG
jgi:peptide/nickel transport system substrate-binding protein